MSAIATAELPSVKNLTREQRQALMLELVKAWFDDAGWPAPFVVRDGEEILGNGVFINYRRHIADHTNNERLGW